VPAIELRELRGNVDSRLRRLREPRGTERHLDGVVLAMAGLTRLFADTATGRHGHALLLELLEGLPLILAPLDDIPSAPGQGALAIECREDDAATLALLQSMDDPVTRAAVGAEREVLEDWGGGCHQKLGATQVPLAAGGSLLRIAGRRPDGHAVRTRRWLPATPLAVPVAAAGASIRAWDGARAPAPGFEPLLDATALRARLAALPSNAAVFIAHWRALPKDAAATLAGRRVWTSGTASWRKLAAQGVWIEGCAEGLGIEALRPTLAEPLLRLPASDHWIVLTHADAVAGWQHEHVIATYRSLEPDTPSAADAAFDAQLRDATHVYWTSSAQFDRFSSMAPQGASHAAGAGKTAEYLRHAGITDLHVFPGVDEWRRWLGLPAG
jgi:hydroxymethylbilane synthase